MAENEMTRMEETEPTKYVILEKTKALYTGMEQKSAKWLRVFWYLSILIIGFSLFFSNLASAAGLDFNFNFFGADKDSYNTGEKVNVWATIKNTGTVEIDAAIANFSIISPNGQTVLADKNSNSYIKPNSLAAIDNAVWTIPNNAEPGQYTAKVAVTSRETPTGPYVTKDASYNFKVNMLSGNQWNAGDQGNTIYLSSGTSDEAYSNVGQIYFISPSYNTYNLPTPVILQNGQYEIMGCDPQAPTTGGKHYFFDHWITSENVSVANTLKQGTTLTVSGSGSLKCITSKFDFSLSVSPSQQTVNAGDTAYFTISVSGYRGFTSTNGYASYIDLSPSGLPPNSNNHMDSPAYINQNQQNTTAIFYVITSKDTPPGTYQITIAGTAYGADNPIVHSQTLSLLVNAPQETKPDLIITDISWSPSDPIEGQQVTFSYTVKNQGTGVVYKFHRSVLEIDGILTSSDEMTSSTGLFPLIATGSSVTRTFPQMWTAVLGTHEIKVSPQSGVYKTEGKVVTITIPKQECTGSSLSCGNCGTQTCGVDGILGVCQNEGVCSSGSSRSCEINGQGGTQICTDSCMWSGCVVTAQKCSDGTKYGSCSLKKPKYCNSDGNLVDTASICGCSSGYIVRGEGCTTDNSNKIPPLRETNQLVIKVEKFGYDDKSYFVMGKKNQIIVSVSDKDGKPISDASLVLTKHIGNVSLDYGFEQIGNGKYKISSVSELFYFIIQGERALGKYPIIITAKKAGYKQTEIGEDVVIVDFNETFSSVCLSSLKYPLVISQKPYYLLKDERRYLAFNVYSPSIETEKMLQSPMISWLVTDTYGNIVKDKNIYNEIAFIAMTNFIIKKNPYSSLEYLENNAKMIGSILFQTTITDNVLRSFVRAASEVEGSLFSWIGKPSQLATKAILETTKKEIAAKLLENIKDEIEKQYGHKWLDLAESQKISFIAATLSNQRGIGKIILYSTKANFDAAISSIKEHPNGFDDYMSSKYFYDNYFEGYVEMAFGAQVIGITEDGWNGVAEDIAVNVFKGYTGIGDFADESAAIVKLQSDLETISKINDYTFERAENTQKNIDRIADLNKTSENIPLIFENCKTVLLTPLDDAVTSTPPSAISQTPSESQALNFFKSIGDAISNFFSSLGWQYPHVL